MKYKSIYIVFHRLTLLLLLLLSIGVYDSYSQRFPKPEFESGYVQAETQIPAPRTDFMEYFDVFVLFLCLSLATWLVLKKRSRKGIFWLGIFSIIYFGFYREGCVCSVGSLQNIALALFNPGYKIPLTIIAFFVLPLLFSLFFGRVFCSGVCPLGAIQDLFVWKPLQMKTWIQKLLGIIPYIYFGLAILYAATSTDFVVCRYDPFVGIYRLNADFTMFVLGGIFLLTSVFIARPYCRFLCPYGVLLNLTSRLSKNHMTITPAECIQCKLCENSCPFGAIEKPDAAKIKEAVKTTRNRFLRLAVLVPILIALGMFVVSQFHETLALVHPKVSLAKEVYNLKNNPELIDETYVESLEIEAYKSAGKYDEQMFIEANEIINDFYIGSLWLGGFIGLVFGLSLSNLAIFKYREDYEPNKGECFSCARCMDYCPVEKSLLTKNK